MSRYYVDTEHVRGERRIYWVADRTSDRIGGRITRGRIVSRTMTKQAAERECARLNASPPPTSRPQEEKG